jgi:hypothetical protein
MEETVTLPKPPEGCEYKIVRKKSVKNVVDLKDRDTSDLTPVQLSKLKYKIENKDKVRNKTNCTMRETKKKSKNKRDYNTRLKNLDHLPTNLQKTNFFYRQNFLRSIQLIYKNFLLLINLEFTTTDTDS